MEIAIFVTMWLAFGAFLFFPTVNAPPVFARMAIGLCASEFVAATIWAVGRPDCHGDSCPALVEVANSVAGLQVPALTGAVLVVACVYGIRVARTW